MRRVARAFPIALAVFAALPAAASAQDDEAEARDLFERAEVARREGRLDETADLLARSLGLLPRAPTAYNLAVVLAEVGRTTEAAALFDALLDGAYGELEEHQRRDVAAKRRSASEALGRLRVRPVGSDASSVRVDGADRGSVAEGETLELALDAGAHVVDVDLESGATVRREVRLGPGAAETLTVAPPALPAPAPTPAPHAPPSDESAGAWSSPWLWIGAGALVALGVVGAVLLFQPEADRQTDPVLGDKASLRF